MPSAVEFQNRTTCELRHEAIAGCMPHWEKIVRLKDHESGLGDFDVRYCRHCRLGFTDPYPTESTTGLLYEDRQGADFDVIRESPVDHVKDLLSRRLLAQLAPHNEVRAVLDFATGNGRFAVSAARVYPGARIDAVDYQIAAPQLLQDRNSGVSYYNLDAFAEQDRRYDLIILRHVLEHTHHPIDLVRQLAARLAPRGNLYIEVPNLESGCAKVFGRYWKNYYVPRHLFHYTTASLAEIVERAGLTAQIGRNEMPMMGNTLSILTGASKSNVLVQLVGMLLHPLQLLIEACFRSSTCINARCRHPG